MFFYLSVCLHFSGSLLSSQKKMLDIHLSLHHRPYADNDQKALVQNFWLQIPGARGMAKLKIYLGPFSDVLTGQGLFVGQVAVLKGQNIKNNAIT